jgi:hypothetical protein
VPPEYTTSGSPASPAKAGEGLGEKETWAELVWAELAATTPEVGDAESPVTSTMESAAATGAAS